MGYFGHTRNGDVLSRFSNDVIEYEENILKAIRQLIIAVINVVLYFAMLLYINFKLTIFVLCLFPIMALVISSITRHLRRNSTTLQQKTSYLMSLIEETISGLRIIKAYTAIEFSNNRFRGYNESYTRLRNKVYRRIDLASPVLFYSPLSRRGTVNVFASSGMLNLMSPNSRSVLWLVCTFSMLILAIDQNPST